MIDRHLIGDVGLAALLAFPTLALARPQAPALTLHSGAAPMVQKASASEQTAVQHRYSLPR